MMRKCRIARDLYSAAMDGDWKKTEEIFEEHPNEIAPSSRLTKFGETCLHIAVIAGQTELVERLVEMMSEEELSIQTTTGDTALGSAFRHGHIEIATIMLKKKPHLGLATLRSLEHSRMVRQLYEVTKNLLDKRDHIDLLLTLIDLCLYDIAKEMLSENLGLAIQENSQGETALSAIAGKVSKTPNGRIELIEQLLKQANGHANLIKGALFRAAIEGNCEFLSRALHLQPDLAIKLDENKHTIFQEVKKFVGPHHMDAENESSKLLFDKEHEELRSKGEEWLKRTAESFFFMTKIITVVSFIAFFGALGESTRRPVLMDNFWFRIFATSIFVSVLISFTSVLSFVSILTAPSFSTSAFLKSLPLNLVLGLFLYVTSILVMMVSSFAAFFSSFNHQELLRYAYPVAAVALISLPFVARYLPLLYHIFRATFMNKYEQSASFCNSF